MTFHILEIIITTDEVIFFRGVGQPPTSWICQDPVHRRPGTAGGGEWCLPGANGANVPCRGGRSFPVIFNQLFLNIQCWNRILRITVWV